MAKVQEEKKPQVAMCHKVISYNDKTTGEAKVFYEFHFIDNPSQNFTVMPSKYFEAVDGGYYIPVLVPYSKAYIDKEGKARVKVALAINWEAYQ